MKKFTREQQQGAGEPLFAGVEELVDEVFFNPDVAREHVGNESVREVVLLVQRAHHLSLRQTQRRGWGHRLDRSHAERLAGQTATAAPAV